MTNKKPRRGRGEGSIYLRKDGRYAASLPIEVSGGKRKRKYFYGKSRAEVRGKLQKAQLEQKQGKLAMALEAFRAAVANLQNTVDADHPKLVLARQLAQQVGQGQLHSPSSR